MGKITDLQVELMRDGLLRIKLEKVYKRGTFELENICVEAHNNIIGLENNYNTRRI
jgi:hypothetical protein